MQVETQHADQFYSVLPDGRVLYLKYPGLLDNPGLVATLEFTAILRVLFFEGSTLQPVYDGFAEGLAKGKDVLDLVKHWANRIDIAHGTEALEKSPDGATIRALHQAAPDSMLADNLCFGYAVATAAYGRFFGMGDDLINAVATMQFGQDELGSRYWKRICRYRLLYMPGNYAEVVDIERAYSMLGNSISINGIEG